ncbi:cytochrome P450 [Saccharothrix coeruleofusca]|uniref:cytochrome P450 n=1 Tax=Saccharothrix coeruleofusca TaxID=33919 RepID=UPI0027DC2D00|nr:cytochrome P450 [Saccharothrix coeruleofusca]MBP2336155.1 cytochrome P450 [Saccharothrix coeruleofusca]
MFGGCVIEDVVEEVREFDHFDPAVAGRIHQLTAALREQRPVARSERHGGFHVLTGWAEIDEVAKDDDRFSSAVEGLGATMVLPGVERVNAPLFETDRPQHTVWRRAMQPFFTPQAAAAHEPYIREVTRGVLAPLRPRGSADLVAEFANRVPLLVTAALLGVERDRREEFGDLARATFGATSAEQARRAGERFAAFLAEQIAARRGAPARDVLTAVVNTEVDGRRASDAELLKHAFLMVAAGHLTTTDTIANTALTLATDARLRQRVTADRSLIPALVEESVRHESAVAATGRTTREDTEVGGVRLTAGERLLLLWGSANRDTTRFPDGDRFRLDRGRVPHLGWGAGAHRCLGMHLARTQLRVVFDELLDAIPGFTVPPGFTPTRTFGVIRGVVSLPVRWPVEG